MKNSRLKQAIKYQLSYFGWSSLCVYSIAIAVLVVISLLVTFSFQDGNTFVGIGGTGFIHLLILGLGIRSDLKFFLQHGISRRTVYFSNLSGSLICSVLLGLFCVIFELIAIQWLSLFGNTIGGGFFENWLMYSIIFFFAWQIGVLISLIYYRLGKIQQVVFSVLAIGAFVLLFSGSVAFIGNFTYDFGGLIERLTSDSLGILRSPVVGLMAILGVIAPICNYFLLRRASIKG